MSENTATTENTETYTAEQLDQMWQSLSDDFKTTVTTINGGIDEHNGNVQLIKASKEQDTTKLLHEIRESNPTNDPDLAKLNAEITKLDERRENLIAKANKLVQEKGLLPGKITEEDVTAAQEATKKSGPALREQIKALQIFEGMMPVKLTPHIKEIQSTRGLALTGSRAGGGEGTWRPRTTAIYLNDTLIQKDVKQPNGEVKAKSTINILAAELNKRTESKSFTTTMIQDAYLAAAGGDKENVPDEVTFELSHTYKNAQGEDTEIKFPVKIVK